MTPPPIHSAPLPFRSRGFSRWVMFGLPLLSLSVLLLLYHHAPLLFTSLMISWGLFYVLSPAVDFLESHSVRRGFATALVLFGTIAVLYLLCLRLISVTADLRAQMSMEGFEKNLIHRGQQMVLWSERKVPILKRFIAIGADKLNDAEKELNAQELQAKERKERKERKDKEQRKKNAVKTNAPTTPDPVVRENPAQSAEEVVAVAEATAVATAAGKKTLEEWAPDMAAYLAKMTGSFLLVPYLTFFFLKDGRKFRMAIISWVPNRYFEPALKFFYEMGLRLRAYLGNTLLDCLLVGLLVGIGSALVGAPYPVLFGVLAFIFNTIPLLGPLVYILLCLIITIGSGKSGEVILGLTAVLAISRVCDDFIFIPTIFGKTHEIHPVVVVCAVLLGETLAGAWGMLLSIPIVSILVLGVGIVKEISVGEDNAPIPPSATGPFG